MASHFLEQVGVDEMLACSPTVIMVIGGGAAFLQKVSHVIIPFKIIIILELNFDPLPMVPNPQVYSMIGKPQIQGNLQFKP